MSKESLRKAYGEALVEAGRNDENLVVLDADLCKSTMSVIFEKSYPERFIEMGIAEQNMTSVAAGLAIGGKIPFINSFAIFNTGRNYDQIRQSICIPKLNVKICGSGCGFSDFGDGSTHQSLEDVSLMRCLPNMAVLVPSDALEVKKAVEVALRIRGPVYIRINRIDMPVITGSENELTVGRPYVVREGDDYVIFSNGVMLHKSLKAAEALEREGISVKVVNVPWVKPMNREDLVAMAKGAKGALVAEEHSKYGGLVGAVSEVLAGEGNIKVRYVAVEDQFGVSAENYEVLLEKYGLTSERIIEAIKGFPD